MSFKGQFLAVFFFLLTYLAIGQKNIDLSYSNIKTVPGSLKQNTEVETLNLSGNPLKELPLWLNEIKSLKRLILDDVSTLPVLESFRIITQSTTLESLSWQRGQLLFLPNCIQNLSSLKNLNIAENAIVKLPLLNKNNNITHLDLSKNLLDTLGFSILHFKKLSHLNLSYNKAVTTEFNYHLLSEITSLNSLHIGGFKSFPEKIALLTSLKKLSIENSKTNTIPAHISKLLQLETLELKNLPEIDFSSSIENVSRCKKLNSLKMYGKGFETIPYNIFKLRSLKKLSINNTCFQQLPTSFSKLTIEQLNILSCTHTGSNTIIHTLSKLKKLKTLRIQQLITNTSDWKLNLLQPLDTLDISNNQLNTLASNLKPHQVLIVKGNYIPESHLKSYRGKIIRDEKYQKINNTGKWRKKLSYNNEQIKPILKKTIYTHIGEDISISGVEISVPPYAFIDKNSNTIDGEVTLIIRIITSSTDIAASNLPLWDKKSRAINLVKAIDIQAIHNEEPAYIDQKKKITISVASQIGNLQHFYRYQELQKNWTKVKSQDFTCQAEQKKNKESSFKNHVYNKLSFYPSTSFNVRSSKVQLRLKRNKRRKTLNFVITPEYGYRENYFQLFGDKIKGYPELKVYKGIKWKYVGDSMERDLKNLYFLSEQAKEEKLKRKSSLNIYVLDIKNITIAPHESNDNYIMSIVQGKDTLKLDVIPHLGFSKATKIQRWHRKKYKKYKRKLSERIKNWKQLDSAYANYYSSYENDLNEFRSKISSEFSKASFHNKDAPHRNLQQSFVISKTGLYGIGKPLVVPQLGKVKAIQLFVSKRRHYGKFILVVNAKLKTRYWQPTKKVMHSLIGKSFAISKVGQNLYYGEIKNKKIALSKTKND